MANLWLHLLRDDRIERSVALETLPLSLGSDPGCDLVLADGPPAAGVIRPGRGARPELLAEGETWAKALEPGGAVRLGPYTLCLQEAGAGSGAARDAARRALEHLSQLVPTLWDGDPAGVETFRALLEMLLASFAARWGAFLDLSGRQAQVVATAGRRPEARGEEVSRTVLERLKGAKQPLLIENLRDHPDLADARSIPLEVQTVLAAPLRRGSRTEGYVYLESPAGMGAFGEDDRALLGRVCDLAAGLLDRARRTRALDALQRADRAGARAPRLVGDGAAMRQVREQLDQVAATDVTTLVVGESGTGKELVARSVHELSARRDQPFVAVHCMALPEDLIEGELFGHVKGAFSGADRERVGRFEMADGGTLFLDEIGELSLSVQVKLLRVLQERSIQRLGEGKDRPVDVRLVTATNADLLSKVEAGTFREDLYYRISVFVLEVPPLRKRLDDLPALAGHLVQEFNQRMGKRIEGLSDAAMDALRAHSWPGNVRELRNVLEQAFVRERGPRLGVESLALPTTGGPPRAAGPAPADAPVDTGGTTAWPVPLEEAKAAFERQHILRALRAEGGNMTRAAKRLAISRAALYKKAGALGIDPRQVRDE